MSNTTQSSKNNNHSQGASQAADLLRTKINALYRKEPSAKQELLEARAHTRPQSRHQQFMNQLSQSGKSLAEIQTAWHNYYISLPDLEKHEVWQEFYADQGKVDANYSNASKISINAHQPSNDPNQPTSATIRSAVSNRARKQSKASIWQSLRFGIIMGFIALSFTMFGLFNERIIAPFITPSKQVSISPIIGSQASVGSDPKVIIPKINVEIPVVFDQTSVAEDEFQVSLEDGVVHYPTTSKPGELGNGAIFGHSSNNILNTGKYKFAFVLLNRLDEGDTFMVNYEGTQYVYKVYKKHVVSPNQVEILDKQERSSTMTLVTCDPPGTSLNRLVVVGEQISPSIEKNVASTAQPSIESQGEFLPSNAPSLWSRLTSWL